MNNFLNYSASLLFNIALAVVVCPTLCLAETGTADNGNNGSVVVKSDGTKVEGGNKSASELSSDASDRASKEAQEKAKNPAKMQKEITDKAQFPKAGKLDNK